MHFSDRAKQWWKARTRLIVPLPTCPVWCRSLVSQSRFLTIKREKERDCFINAIWLTLNRPACVQQTLSVRNTCLECCLLSLISAAKIISQTKPLITQYSDSHGHQGAPERQHKPSLLYTHIEGWRWGRHRRMTAKNNGCQETQTQKHGAFHMQNPLRMRPTDKEHGMCLCAQLRVRHNVCSDTLGFSSTGRVYLQQSVLFWKACCGLCTH